VRWGGQPITQAQLLARGADFIRRAVQRLGGAENVRAENFPSANLQIDDGVRYRCIAPVLKTLAASGFAEVRIENASAFNNANPLVFWMDLYTQRDRNPPVDPIKNLVRLSATGLLSWNGELMDFVRLRQYLDLTMTMNPLPLLRLDFDPEARFGVVRSALEVVWRAHLERVELVLPDDAGRRAGDNMSFRPTYIVKRVRRR
jgi:biopolymer transport protein ExbD